MASARRSSSSRGRGCPGQMAATMPREMAAALLRASAQGISLWRRPSGEGGACPGPRRRGYAPVDHIIGGPCSTFGAVFRSDGETGQSVLWRCVETSRAMPGSRKPGPCWLSWQGPGPLSCLVTRSSVGILTYPLSLRVRTWMIRRHCERCSISRIAEAFARKRLAVI